jgi:hypothetical protein
VIDPERTDTVIPMARGTAIFERITTMADYYLGNKRTKQYHDLGHETAGCQIEEIKEPVYFSTRQQAAQAGYDPCGHCLGEATR